MKKFTSEMVQDYAGKLLIGLSEEENAMVLKEFDIIDHNMELITKIPDIEKIEPMTHALDDFVYELRDDVATKSPDIEELLQNCDSYEGREIVVPKVVGGDN